MSGEGWPDTSESAWISDPFLFVLCGSLYDTRFSAEPLHAILPQTHALLDNVDNRALFNVFSKVDKKPYTVQTCILSSVFEFASFGTITISTRITQMYFHSTPTRTGFESSDDVSRMR